MKDTIEIKNLTYKSDNNIIFKDLNMSFKYNDTIGVVGNNKSGKTTLVKLLGGLLPNNNSITYGYSYLNSDRFNDHSKDIGIVFGNNFNMFLFDSVYKEMAFPLENLSMDPKQIESKILELAKFFGISDLLDLRISDLTNCEKQILEIVISLLHDPKVLLLDNPFSMMDNKTKNIIKNKLIKYKKNHNLTLIIFTSDLSDIYDCDYLYIIHKGNVVLEGLVKDVLLEDTIIDRVGLNMPLIVDLSLKLKYYGLIDDITFDLESMVNNIWK